MLNRNSSARTAAKKWFKCSLLQRPAIILTMLLLCAVFPGCSKDNGIDLTYKVVTYNKNGSYNSVDILGYSFLLILVIMSYISGKSNDKILKILWKAVLVILVLLPIVLLLPK